MILKEQLAALAGVEAPPVVSIYLPTHEKARETRQDPIRMRNALAAVTERLVGAGHRRPEVEELLKPAQALVDDDLFWRHQAQGLAVFVAPGGLFQAHKLPIEVPEKQEVGPRPHLKPLLPLLADDGRFYVLCVRAGDCQLHQGSRFGIAEIEAEGLPSAGVAEITAETDYEQTIHAAPQARPRAGSPVGMPGATNFGEAPEEQRKAQLIEYLRRIDDAVKRRIGADQAPVVLVGQPEVQGHLRALSKEVRLLEEGVAKDPSALKREELHALAYEVAKPVFARGRELALDKFRARVGSNDPRAGTDLHAVVTGARFGRVDALFVAEGQSVWGHHDGMSDKVRIDQEPTAENEDLIDYAAVHSLLGGAPVWVLPRDQMPAEAPACATFRF